MESFQPAEQLSDIDRLRSETVRESVRGRPWALPLLAVVGVIFLSAYALDWAWIPVIAPLAWLAFVVLWVRWLRAPNRARPGRQRAVRDWRREVPVWLGLFVTANLIAVLGATVSWLLAGALMATFGAVAGLALPRLARR